MSLRRGASGLSGILPVDKPQGLTSHDVVNVMRRATGEKRVGHAGTLDPMATGLLVLLIGPATRLAPYLTAATKTYEAVIAFGTETDTDDAEGTVVRTADIPEDILDPSYAEAKVAALVGTHQQVPPAFSAIKRDGQVAHRAARAGQPLTLEPRAITIDSARLLGLTLEPAAWQIVMAVSKGTYVRAVARDLGREVGSAAHLTALRRTTSGALDLDGAVPLSRLEGIESARGVTDLFVDPVRALGLPTVEVNETGALRVANGSALSAEVHCEGRCPEDGHVVVVREGLMLAVYSRHADSLKAAAVFPDGLRGGVG